MFRPQVGHHQADTERTKRFNTMSTQWDPIAQLVLTLLYLFVCSVLA